MRIDPATPAPDDDLVCSVEVESTDADGDTITYSYAWSKDGIDMGMSLDTVAASQTALDEEWTCTVTPNDGAEDGPSGTASVVISDDACWSLEFDGIDDYVDLPSAVQNNLIEPFTIETWIKSEWSRGSTSQMLMRPDAFNFDLRGPSTGDRAPGQVRFKHRVRISAVKNYPRKHGTMRSP